MPCVDYFFYLLFAIDIDGGKSLKAIASGNHPQDTCNDTQSTARHGLLLEPFKEGFNFFFFSVLTNILSFFFQTI